MGASDSRRSSTALMIGVVGVITVCLGVAAVGLVEGPAAPSAPPFVGLGRSTPPDSPAAASRRVSAAPPVENKPYQIVSPLPHSVDGWSTTTAGYTNIGFRQLFTPSDSPKKLLVANLYKNRSMIILIVANGSFAYPENLAAKLTGLPQAPGVWSPISPGPHGGGAVCGTGTFLGTICAFETSTDFGEILVPPSVPLYDMNTLILRFRRQLERPA